MEADPRSLPTWVTEWADHTTNYGRAGGVLDPRPRLEAARYRLPQPTANNIARMLQEAEAWANGAWEA
jgi:hypothetical protein